MKNLMRVLSVLLVFSAIILIILCTFESTNLDFLMFAYKILAICSANILPIISIALCAYCMERNDTNYVVRIIPIFMTVPILISIIIALFDANADWLTQTYEMISKTFISITAVSFVLVIKPNNQISKVISYLCYGLILANFILPLVLEGNASATSLLSSYSYASFLGQSEFLLKMFYATVIAEIFAIPLLYITNYAFSDKIEVEADVIDYEAVKEDAMNVANAQMENIYNRNENKVEEIDRSASEKGLMNVNNQLGQDSNVGTVKSQAKEMNVRGSSLDSLMPLSSGPIANNATEQPTQTQVAAQPAQQATPQETTPPAPTTPPNVDIQEEMKRKMEQAQAQTQQAVPQQNIQPAVTQQQTIQQAPAGQNVNQQNNIQ